LDVNLRKKLFKCSSLCTDFVWCWNLGHFWKRIRDSWRVLKCGAGEGWRGSVGPIVWEMKMYYIESRKRGISYIQWKEGRLFGLVTSCVELPSKTRYWKKKDITKDVWREDKEEDVGNY
jgi:hypothetical protein